LPGPTADELRAAWGEEIPRPSTRSSPAELWPGILDPIPDEVFEHSPPGWASLDQTKHRHMRALAEMCSMRLSKPENREGTGIVYVGGGKYWPMIAVGLRMCRRFTDLPIQVWYQGVHEPIQPDEVNDLVGVTFHDTTAVVGGARKFGGWENKTTAILHSGLARVLYLDADAYLVADPSALLETGRISSFAFWSDLPWNDSSLHWDWSGVTNRACIPPVQGGQLVIDVVGSWRMLIVAHWINQHSDYWYAHQFGDQDSWRLAIAATGESYHNLGAAGWAPPSFICSYPGPLVVHRCQGKLWRDQPAPMNPGLPGEKELRDFWEAYVLGRGDATDVFTRVYRSNFWGVGESSGDGSKLEEAQPLLDLMATLRDLGAWRSIVDLGCGSGLVASHLPFDLVEAVDVYSPHLERRRAAHPAIRWHMLDVDRDRELLPAGDVALMKDVLHHWPSDLVVDWLTWAMQCGKWKWLVIAQDRQQHDDNSDCILGGYRALDYRMSPLKAIPVRPLMKWIHKEAFLVECASVTRSDREGHSPSIAERQPLGVTSNGLRNTALDQTGRAQ
jgi:hypothetical protein